MKKTLSAVLLVPLLLSGCGLFKSDLAWQQAKQRAPLDIPSGMDRPDVSDALTIPRVNDTPTPETSRTLHVGAAVSAAYQQIGAALDGADHVAVTHSDSGTHQYRAEVGPGVHKQSKRGFVARLFGLDRIGKEDREPPSLVGRASVSVQADNSGGSTVSVKGDGEAVATVVDALKPALGH